MTRNRRFWRLTLTAAVVGVAMRAWYILYFIRRHLPLWGDAQNFHEMGGHLAAGRGYIQPYAFRTVGEQVATAEYPPLYPMFLGLADFIGVDSPIAQRLLGALLGGATIVMIALVGFTVGGLIVGVTSAWIAALYPQLILIDGSLMSENPYVLLVASVLFGVLRARSAESDHSRVRWWVFSGVMVGLAIMTRSEAWLLVFLLLIPLTRVPGDRQRWMRLAAVACAGAIVMGGAWTFRNAISLDTFQPFTNNSGWLLAGANCDTTYSGKQLGSWNLLCIPEGLSENESEKSAQAREVGLEYMREHASDVPRVVAVRVLRTFGAWDIRTNLFLEYYEGRDYNWLWAGWYAWLVLAPLAAAGALVRRRRGGELWLLVAPVVMVAVVSALTYGNQRFRAAAEPSIVVLAAVGAVAAAQRIRQARHPRTSEQHE